MLAIRDHRGAAVARQDGLIRRAGRDEVDRTPGSLLVRPKEIREAQQVEREEGRSNQEMLGDRPAVSPAGAAPTNLATKRFGKGGTVPRAEALDDRVRKGSPVVRPADR